MVLLGHKTDEQERVLIKKNNKQNSWGAQGVKILCLSSMAFVLMSGFAVAQAPVYSTNNSTAAQTEVRLQQMETQIRELTGRVENQIYEINKLKQEIKRLESSGTVAGSPGVSDGFTNGEVTNWPEERRVDPPAPGQIALPMREKASPPDVTAKSTPANPLNLDFKPPAIAGMKTAVPGNSGDATASYERAFANLKIEKYQEAQEGFESFLENHPEHVLSANAKYWLGETYYVRGEYKKSARVFAEGFQTYPDSAKSPDILLKLGMSLVGMGKKKEACVALSQVEVKFPNGSAPVTERAKREMEKLGCEA